jgi:hypothetical protein
MKSAVKFAVEKYITKSVRKRIYVTVKFIENFTDFENCAGECGYLGMVNGKRKFYINVVLNEDTRYPDMPSLKYKETLRTLFHELVHLKQYVNNELFDYANGSVRYRGDIYNSDHDYWESPWEIEAMGRSEGLYYQFVDPQKKET